MIHTLLAILAAVVVGDGLLVLALYLRAQPHPTKAPSPPAQPLFQIGYPMVRMTPQGSKYCLTVWAETPAEAVEGILLAAHGVES